MATDLDGPAAWKDEANNYDSFLVHTRRISSSLSRSCAISLQYAARRTSDSFCCTCIVFGFVTEDLWCERYKVQVHTLLVSTCLVLHPLLLFVPIHHRGRTSYEGREVSRSGRPLGIQGLKHMFAETPAKVKVSSVSVCHVVPWVKATSRIVLFTLLTNTL